MPKTSVIKTNTFHYKWSKSHKPVLYIKRGDRVHFEVNEVTTWQLNEDSTAEDLAKLDFSKLYPMSGPVYVEGAKPGDALVVNIEEVRPADWGWSAILPGFGLLEEFKQPRLHIWRLRRGRRFADYKAGIRVRLNPFCGVYGVAPAEDGYFDVMPPGRHGGNMDIKHLTKGAKLLLPVWTEGALFSTSDVHAAQGDGEVCVTAIECAGGVTLTFDLERNANISGPQYFTKSPERSGNLSRFVTTGIAPDLMTATKQAVRGMIERLSKDRAISEEDAYMLCSVAGDLRIHEVVDAPNWVVGMMMESSILRKGG